MKVGPDLSLVRDKFSVRHKCCDFGNVGHNLARGIPNVDTQPEHGFISTDKTSFESCSANEVFNLLEKLKVKKASGLDNLPSKFLKIGTDILT